MTKPSCMVEDEQMDYHDFTCTKVWKLCKGVKYYSVVLKQFFVIPA